jgi:ABC-type uncharacterized transport system ATPase subunit
MAINYKQKRESKFESYVFRTSNQEKKRIKDSIEMVKVGFKLKYKLGSLGHTVKSLLAFPRPVSLQL